MKNLIPKFTTKPKMMFNAIDKIDQPFLQGLIRLGGMIINECDGFTLFAFDSYAFFFVRENGIVLECLSTTSEHRKRGSGSKTLRIICEVAKTTDTPLSLRVTKVTKSGGQFITLPIAIEVGSKIKGKIPVRVLPSWYEKFGFERVESGSQRGIYMEFKSSDFISN